MLAAARIMLVLLAAVPLLVDDGVLYPFVSAKALALRAAVTAAALLLVAELVRDEEYRQRLAHRLASLRRSPVAIAIGALLSITLVSAALGVNPTRSVLGDAERAEGFVGLAALAAFFVLTHAIFERRHWNWFFAVMLLSAAVLLGHAIWLRAQGELRPGSFTGHPAYLGPVAFFTIVAAVVIASHAGTRSARMVALAGLPMALAIMLLSQTRAALLGFGIASLVVLAFVVIRTSRASRRREATLRTVVIAVILGGMFLATRDAAIWQRIPGVRRVATWHADDPTTQWRLGVWEAGLASTSPAASGWKRLLVGWGPENLHVPVNQHYEPTRFVYDPAWYDRSHNTLIDSLLTTGIPGLLASLALWVALVHGIVRSRQPLAVQAAMLFATVAYFVQNQVSFESLSTSVPFFAMLAFVASRADQETPGSSGAPMLGLAVAGGIAVLGSLLLLSQTLPAYSQMRQYVRLYRESVPLDVMLERWSDLRRPWTYAQEAIRADFLPRTRVLVRANRDALPVMAAAIEAMADVTRRDSLNARRQLEVGEALGELADLTGRPEVLRQSLAHLERAALLAPGKTHVRNALALAGARAACSRHPSVCHYETLRAMVAERNGEGATLVKERLDLLDPPRRPLLALLAGKLSAGRWDDIHVSLAGDLVTITLAPDPQE